MCCVLCEKIGHETYVFLESRNAISASNSTSTFSTFASVSDTWRRMRLCAERTFDGDPVIVTDCSFGFVEDRYLESTTMAHDDSRRILVMVSASKCDTRIATDFSSLSLLLLLLLLLLVLLVLVLPVVLVLVLVVSSVLAKVAVLPISAPLLS